MSSPVVRYLSVWDYVAVAVVLVASASIGIYFRFSGGKQKTLDEYLLANKNVSVIPVAFSLMASFLSAVGFLGIPKEIYSDGTQFLIIYAFKILATAATCYIYLPVLYNLQKTSCYEYLECRFGSASRLCASLGYTIQQVLYMGIVIYAPALALAAITGLSQNWSIVVVCLSCTISTSIGGMKAVLAADVLQSFVMFAGISAVFIKGIADFGFRGIFQRASEGGRIEFFNFSPDPKTRHTFWSVSIGGVIAYLTVNSVNQTQVQRLLTTKSLKDARLSLWYQYIIVTILGLLFGFAGLILYAQYHSCDPLRSGQITNADQILPFYVLERLGEYPGVPGIFIAGVFSGSLSSISSAVNSMSAVTMHDHLLPLFSKLNCSKWQKRTSTLTKFLSFTYGLIFMGAAYLTGFLGKALLQFTVTVFHSIGGPLLGMFTLGMLSAGAHQKGALTGFFAGVTLSFWIGFGEPKYPSDGKPTSIEGCPSLNATHFTTVFPPVDVVLLDEQEIAYSVNPQPIPSSTFTPNITDVEGFNFLKELYSISYLWIGPLSFLVTFIVGYISSHVIPGRRKVDPNLLSPLYFKIWRTSREDSKWHLEGLDNKALEIQEYPVVNDGKE